MRGARMRLSACGTTSIAVLVACAGAASAARGQVTCAPVPPKVTRFVHAYRPPEAPWERALYKMHGGNTIPYMKSVRAVEDIRMAFRITKAVEPALRLQAGDLGGAAEGLLDTPENLKGVLEQADVVGKLTPLASTPAEASFVTAQAAEGGTSLPYRIEYYQRGPSGDLQSLDSYADYCGSVLQKQGRLSDLLRPPAAVRPKGRTVNLKHVLVAGGVAVGAIAVLGRTGEGVAEAENAQPCNATTRSGGYGVTATVHDLGKKSGTFVLEWNALSVPDRFTVTYEGKTLFDSGVVSGLGQRSISYSGRSRQVTVTVTGDRTGTQWSYTVRCP